MLPRETERQRLAEFAKPTKDANKAWVRALSNTASIAREPTTTLPHLVEKWEERYGDAPALISTSHQLTFCQLAERCRRYTRWALAQGLGRGDAVALMMSNCPEYLAIWLGISRVGAIVALINTNLTDASLAHAINVAHPRAMIVAAEFAAAVDNVRAQLVSAPACWASGDTQVFNCLDCEIMGTSGSELDAGAIYSPTIADPALYIYTSGTTGLPKAAKVSHFRLMQWSLWFAGLMDTGPGDRMYDCLPMYHSIGGVVAVGASLVNGGAVVIRERFSAGQFWEDVVAFDCTIFQYIGELCRYLLNSVADIHETPHRLRLCCGNGLRAEVWERFQQRFRIPRILEFYASTEGNISLYNCEGKPGAIGHIPSFLAHRYPIALIRIDPQTSEPVRDAQGFAIRCTPDEPGEALGEIADHDLRSGRAFEGYTDRGASEQKILRDVFAPGDAWYRTGDLMRRDAQGYFYFVDRLGDTFRWKGENVSTAEVAEVVAAAPGVIDAVVYGVAIPGAEGRAAMAAAAVTRDFDSEALHQHLATQLPSYARPLFVRLVARIDLTATFKATKQELVRQGFDPCASPDPILFNDSAQRRYRQLDQELYERIRRGEIGL